MADFKYLEQIKSKLGQLASVRAKLIQTPLDTAEVQNHELEYTDWLFSGLITAIKQGPSQVSEEEIQAILTELEGRNLPGFNFELARSVERHRPEMMGAFSPWFRSYCIKIISPAANEGEKGFDAQAYTYPLYALFGHVHKSPSAREPLRQAFAVSLPRLVTEGRFSALTSLLSVAQLNSRGDDTVVKLIPAEEVVRAFEALEKGAAESPETTVYAHKLGRLTCVLAGMPVLLLNIPPTRVAHVLDVLMVTNQRCGTELIAHDASYPNCHFMNVINAFRPDRPRYLKAFTAEHLAHYGAVAAEMLKSSQRGDYAECFTWFVGYSKGKPQLRPTVERLLPVAIGNILESSEDAEKGALIIRDIGKAVQGDAELYNSIAPFVEYADDLVTVFVERKEEQRTARRALRARSP